MQDPRINTIARDLQEKASQFLVDQAQLSSQAQLQYLKSRQVALRQISALVRMQAEHAGGGVPTVDVRTPPMIDREQLEEFAAGSVERGLGPEYALFRGRRIPRIPNGDLLMMDRILEIQGERGKLKPGSEIRTEIDIPVEAWYFQDSGTSTIPYSILMELALQPCGYLSAHLGTILIHPNNNLYFRNLDGEAVIHRQVDLRGQTVGGWARLLSHTVNEETVIQKFEFHLETGGQVFYSGQSVFGFFPEENMLRQVGLDGGKTSLPLCLQPESAGQTGARYVPSALVSPSGLHLAVGKLALLDEIYIQPGGGAYSHGYIYGRRAIRPEDWYFRNHFFQDPVMPGSLGVEAILEAMRAYAIAQRLDETAGVARFELVDDLPCKWKYRGQILATPAEMHLEVHIRQIVLQPHEALIVGDASLWNGAMRIYQLKNGAIRIAKGSLS